MTISSLTLASRAANTLSVTWSAGYPKCYSFTVSHSTQDGSINVTQPADSDTSHTLTSLQPGTTYRIEVEAVRKGDGADGQRAKVMWNFTTEDVGEESSIVCVHIHLTQWWPNNLPVEGKINEVIMTNELMIIETSGMGCILSLLGEQMHVLYTCILQRQVYMLNEHRCYVYSNVGPIASLYNCPHSPPQSSSFVNTVNGIKYIHGVPYV